MKLHLISSCEQLYQFYPGILCEDLQAKDLGLRQKCLTLLLPICETQHWPSHKFSQLYAAFASQDKIGVQDDTNMIYKEI